MRRTLIITNKEIKKRRNSLKKEIDNSETWILLALSGEKLQCDKNPEATQTREAIISRLKEIRANIQEKTEMYVEAIDDAINRIS